MLGERTICLVFVPHTGPAWLTARKVEFCGLDLFFWFCAVLISGEEPRHRHEHLMFFVPFRRGLTACLWRSSTLRLLLSSQECPPSHLHLPNNCWRTQIRHPFVSSPWLWPISPLHCIGFPQQLTDLSHHGKVLSACKEWACWDMGLVPLIQGGRSILMLISRLKPPPFLTVISRSVFHTHHQHQEGTFPQRDKWHQIKEH